VAAGLELDAIAASVLGGASLFGGVGRVGGTIVGAFVMSVLNNGLNLLEVSSLSWRCFWTCTQKVANGHFTQELKNMI
jgi:ribose/xylose/arabinose/galactoside ABC-type transport system permease subunit